MSKSDKCDKSGGRSFIRESGSVSIGLVGLPNVGKSFLFNTLCGASVPSENYSFCTVEPNVGYAVVGDARVDFLAGLSASRKRVYPVMKVFDIAGLIENCSEGKGLGNQFLSHIRDVSAIFHVVRAFEGSVEHVYNSVDPLRDLRVVERELVLKDMEVLERARKRRDPELAKLIDKLQAILKEEGNIREHEWTEAEYEKILDFNLLSVKEVLVLANISKEQYENKKVNKHLKSLAGARRVVPFYPGIPNTRICQEGLRMLKLNTFYTTGEMETRAWMFREGRTARECAGLIHTDFKKKFIRAEVYNVAETQTLEQIRREGKVHTRGKEYIMQDGDVVLFKIGK